MFEMSGYVYQLCFDTSDEKKTECVSSVVHYEYHTEDARTSAFEPRDLLGFGKSFILYKFVYDGCHTYDLVHMPDMKGDKHQFISRASTIKCPRHKWDKKDR